MNGLSEGTVRFLPSAKQQSHLPEIQDLGRVLALKDQLHAFDLSFTGTTDPTAATTSCGYVVNKFICKSQGTQANKDLAAACSGGGQFACTGVGEQRTCACAFD